MLILSRKVGERINIGDGVSLIVCKIEGTKVRLGIEAPRDVKIMRAEVDPEEKRSLPIKPAVTRSILPPLSSFIATTTYASA